MNYQDDLVNKIIHGDCLQIMKDIPDETIGLVLTDPPYGDDSAYGRMSKSIIGNENPLLACSAISEIYRVLKPNSNCYIFTNSEHCMFIKIFIILYSEFKIKTTITWVKGNIGMGHGFRKQSELILVLEKGTPIYRFDGFSDVQETQVITHDETTHPHEKPISLLERIILHSSEIKDIVLDPFAGSGTTLSACASNDRRYIGIEIDEKWVEYTKRRLSSIQKNLPY